MILVKLGRVDSYVQIGLVLAPDSALAAPGSKAVYRYSHRYACGATLAVRSVDFSAATAEAHIYQRLIEHATLFCLWVYKYGPGFKLRQVRAIVSSGPEQPDISILVSVTRGHATNFLPL